MVLGAMSKNRPGQMTRNMLGVPSNPFMFAWKMFSAENGMKLDATFSSARTIRYMVRLAETSPWARRLATDSSK